MDEKKRLLILECFETLMRQGKMASVGESEQQYEIFRKRFGPSALKRVDGDALLSLMHDHSNRDSLVYWLEFKNDEEFETRNFGSIAGGSALKFRIFRRRETGRWQAGGPGNYPKDISESKAVEIARSHREQLLNGVRLLERLPDDASDRDYAELQAGMDRVAPEVSRLAWGHKYFSLLFPNKLDDYHSAEWQRFHLLKLLQMPPEGEGRYVCAGRFVAAAREVGIRLTDNFTAVLNTIHGSLHRYWRIGSTRADRNSEFFWERDWLACGWPKVGDLSGMQVGSKSRQQMKSLIEKHYPNDPGGWSRVCSQIIQFAAEMAEGDIVIATNKDFVEGIGRVLGGYEFHGGDPRPHCRRIEWLNREQWQLPVPAEGSEYNFRRLGKSNENLLAIEERLQARYGLHADDDDDGEEESTSVNRFVRLAGIPGRIQSILERKGQVVLYGPPGTGKTFWAERSANDLAAISAFGKLFEDLEASEQETIIGQDSVGGLVRMCCFHPAYGYEDFIEGYRPHTVDGQVSFELRDGIFKKLCSDAVAAPDHNFYLIVDEINRGDIPRIFGELLTILEKDKRTKRIMLPVSQEMFSVPRNVFIVGTMNTADRSISLLDAALRRRFGFVELMPDGDVFEDASVAGVPLKAWLGALNKRIREHVGRDSRNLQIGHSYLMHNGSAVKDIGSLKRAIRDEVIPLLEEYCYEDYGALGNILGEQLVDVSGERIRHELFDDGQEDSLVQGILAPFPEIVTSSEAILSDEKQATAETAGEEDES